MNKPGFQLQTPAFLVDRVSHVDDSVRHLLVLLPAGSDYPAATRRVWELADELHASVRLLGLYGDPARESSMRRDLVTMASLLEDGKVLADWRAESGTNWGRAVKRNYQAGDAIVCFAEQRTGLLQRPLSHVLQSDLSAPVYILSSLDPEAAPQSSWLSQCVLWIGLLAIIASAFLLQVRITSLPQDWVQTTLMILSVLGEIWLIWVWNSLFG